jgi:tetratricopeptide (TPR) repeat protein
MTASYAYCMTALAIALGTTAVAQTEGASKASTASQSTAAAAAAQGVPASGKATVVTPNAQTAEQRSEVPQSVGISKLQTEVEAYRQEGEQARLKGAKEEEAEAALKQARTLEVWSRVDKTKVANVTEVESAYRTAMATGNIQQRSNAVNNLAVFLLRQGRATDALSLFSGLDFSSVAPGERYLYEYNYGRVLELNNDRANAAKQYSEAVALRPDFMPAVDGAFRLLAGRADAARSAADLADVLIRGGRAAMARIQLKQHPDLWNGPSDVSPILEVLVRSYVASPVPPPVFVKEDVPWLYELRVKNPSLAAGVYQLELAYSGKFAYSFRPTATFQYWSEGQRREPFGNLLKQLGDYYADQGQYPAALACDSNSWVLARLPEAAVYTAALLRDQAQTLDPQGKLLDSFIEGLFTEKGGSYVRQDWPNILRLHTVLGTIFEQQGRWGSSWDSRSAIFQWEHALEADKQMRARGGHLPPAPGLHMHMATSYEKAGRLADARREYLAAADIFAQASEKGEAASAKEKADALTI